MKLIVHFYLGNFTVKTFNSLLPTLKNVWQHVLTWMYSSSEIQVWQESDCYGCTYCWHAYDPMTGRSVCFGSEEEIRIWIEQSYYCNTSRKL